MRRTYMLPILLILLSCGAFAQQETVGFEVNQQYRHLDSYKTTSSLWSMSYRNLLQSNTRVTASLGLDNIKLFIDDNATDPILKSNYQIFVQAGAMQTLYYFYVKGAIQYYTINGNSYEATSSESKIKYDNSYKMFEFPLGAGLTVPTKYFDIFLGVNKTFYYGSNQKEVIVKNGSTETSLGNSVKTTFKSEFDFAIEGTLVYHLTRDMDIEINALRYSDKDFSFKLSLWGPLKRMY